MHGDTTPENYPLASVLYTTLLSLIGHQKQANEQNQTMQTPSHKRHKSRVIGKKINGRGTREGEYDQNEEMSQQTPLFHMLNACLRKHLNIFAFNSRLLLHSIPGFT